MLRDYDSALDIDIWEDILGLRIVLDDFKMAVVKHFLVPVRRRSTGIEQKTSRRNENGER